MSLVHTPPPIEKIVDFVRNEYLRQLDAENEYELLNHGFRAEMLEDAIQRADTYTDLLGFGRELKNGQPRAVLVAANVDRVTHIIAMASDNKGGGTKLLARLLDRSEPEADQVKAQVHETNKRAMRFLENAQFTMVKTSLLSPGAGHMVHYIFDLPVERVTATQQLPTTSG